MSVAHRKWKKALLLQINEDDARANWNDAFDDLFDWIDEIESYEEYRWRESDPTDEYQLGWHDAIDSDRNQTA